MDVTQTKCGTNKICKGSFSHNWDLVLFPNYSNGVFTCHSFKYGYLLDGNSNR